MQIIGVGASANDGTGDTLRAAFEKVNANAAEMARAASGAVTLESFGAIGDGVTDDTAAIAAAVSVAGRAILLRPGAVYACGEIAPEDGVSFNSWAGRGYTGYSFPGEDSLRARMKMLNGANCLLNVTGKNGVSSRSVVWDGVNKSAPVISGGSNRFTGFDSRFIRGSMGIGGSVAGGDGYSHSPMLTLCVVASNAEGLRNPIDGRFVEVEFSSNGDNVRGDAGSNGNSFGICRFEWPQFRSLYLFGSSGAEVVGWLFSGCYFDRGEIEAIYMKYARGIAFGASRFARSNRSESSVQEEDALITMSQCAEVSLSGCTYTQGRDDGATSGNFTPSTVIVFSTACDNISVVGGAVKGGFTNIVKNTNLATNFVMLGVAGAPDYRNDTLNAQLEEGGWFRAKVAASGGVAAGASGNIVLATRTTVNTYDAKMFDVNIVAKDATTGNTYIAKAMMSIQRSAGSASATLTIAAQSSAGYIGVGSGTISLSVSSVASDGSSVILTVTNNHATNLAAVGATLI